MLNIIILILISIALIIHRHLTVFWEKNRLPYQTSFLLLANTLILLYLVNFIWMFGWLYGIIIFALTLFQVVYATFLWPFVIPWVIKVNKSLSIPKVSSGAYATFFYLIPIIAILTIINFFVSDYKSILGLLKNFIINKYYIIILFVIISNIVRSYTMKKLSS